MFEWCICLIVAHTSPRWAWYVSTQFCFRCLTQNKYRKLLINIVSCVRPNALYCIHVDVFSKFSPLILYTKWLIWITPYFLETYQTLLWFVYGTMRPITHVHCPNTSVWVKYKLKWTLILTESMWQFFFQISGQLMSQQCTFIIYQFQ